MDTLAKGRVSKSICKRVTHSVAAKFHSINSSGLIILWPVMRGSTFVSQAWGSTPLSLAVSSRVKAIAMALPPRSEPESVDSDVSGTSVYFFGWVLAFVIFAVKYGILEAVFYGWMVAFLSWLYVGFAVIQALFG